MQNNSRPKSNIFLQLAGVLLLLILFTACMMSGLYARYTTTAQGSDSARVAKFDTEAIMKNASNTDIAQFDISLAPGNPDNTYYVVVTNNSEVSVNCSVSAVNETGNLPLTFVLTQENNAIAYSGSVNGSIAPGDTLTYTVKIGWQANETGYLYAGQLDSIAISVQCEQIN